MLRKTFLSVLIGLKCLVVSAQGCPKYEQIALDYFFEQIFLDYYTQNTKLAFSYQVENTTSSFAFMSDCFSKGSATRIALGSPRTVEDTLHSDLKLSHHLKVKNKARIKLKVFGHNRVNDKIYVRIDLDKKHATVRSFFIVLNENFCVMDWCLTGHT